MKMIRVALACVAMAALPAAAQKTCSPADQKAAEKAVDRVSTFPQLKKAWQDYGHCDTGTVGDIYTDAILRLVVEWKNVEIVAWDAQSDPKYKEFIHKHLLSPMAKDDRDSVHSRAKLSCPPAQDAFCAELVEITKPIK
jgi:hypothetical protein